MQYLTALKEAEAIKALLEPHCERIEIAGSIRREKSECKDIEIVCIPKQDPQIVKLMPGRKFVHGYPCKEFVDQVNQWRAIKGKPTGKYTQRIVNYTTVDIFIANPDNWGVIFFIRTGSAEYVKRVIGIILTGKGYKCEEGELWNGKEKLAVAEEQQIFELAQLPYVSPVNRY